MQTREQTPLPSTADLTESIMLRPTFGQHFDAVVVDWSYVERRSATQASPQLSTLSLHHL